MYIAHSHPNTTDISYRDYYTTAYKTQREAAAAYFKKYNTCTSCCVSKAFIEVGTWQIDISNRLKKYFRNKPHQWSRRTRLRVRKNTGNRISSKKIKAIRDHEKQERKPTKYKRQQVSFTGVHGPFYIVPCTNVKFEPPILCVCDDYIEAQKILGLCDTHPTLLKQLTANLELIHSEIIPAKYIIYWINNTLGYNQ